MGFDETGSSTTWFPNAEKVRQKQTNGETSRSQDPPAPFYFQQLCETVSFGKPVMHVLKQDADQAKLLIFPGVQDTSFEEITWQEVAEALPNIFDILRTVAMCL